MAGKKNAAGLQPFASRGTLSRIVEFWKSGGLYGFSLS
jgi:hypothetical protein